MALDIIKLSTDWAKAEVFSSKVAFLLSALFFIAAIGFWQLGKTAAAKAFIWPLCMAGALILAAALGLYFANKPRIERFNMEYKKNPAEFIQKEIERTAKSQRDFIVLFKIFPILIALFALFAIFIKTPLFRACSLSAILLMTILLFLDSNTSARNDAYHEELLKHKDTMK